MAKYITSAPTWVFDKLIPAGDTFEVGDDVPPAKCWKRIDDEEAAIPKRRGRKAEAAEDGEAETETA